MTKTNNNQTAFHARWTEDRTTPQALREHLAGVTQRARSFAEGLKHKDQAFVCAAFLAGLLYDLGKYRVEFQNYLNMGDRSRRSSDTAHAIYGAASTSFRTGFTSLRYLFLQSSLSVPDSRKPTSDFSSKACNTCSITSSPPLAPR